jgi:peptidyl-prolyl cis-trans isomerase C
MRNYRRLIPGLFILAVILSLCACEKRASREKGPEERILARINGYKMTVSDFNNEKKPFLNYAQIQEDPAKLKDQILRQLITRQLLLQEAQKLNLDKEKAFMKEIENYWKQALLTSLLRNKSDELKGKIEVTEREIEREYGSMQRRLLVESVSLSDAQSALKLSAAKEDFDAVKQSLSREIISDAGSQWWEYKDMSRAFKDAVSDLNKGKICQPFKENGYWQVVRIIDVESQSLEPLENMKHEIMEQIKNEKVAQNLEAWVNKLTKEAQIKIDPKVLEDTKLN